jgi:hypothetical protein
MDIFLTPERDGSVLMSKCGLIPVSVEDFGLNLLNAEALAVQCTARFDTDLWASC